jgi:hypothetical protein
MRSIFMYQFSAAERNCENLRAKNPRKLRRHAPVQAWPTEKPNRAAGVIKDVILTSFSSITVRWVAYGHHFLLNR